MCCPENDSSDPVRLSSLSLTNWAFVVIVQMVELYIQSVRENIAEKLLFKTNFLLEASRDWLTVLPGGTVCMELIGIASMRC